MSLSLLLAFAPLALPPLQGTGSVWVVDAAGGGDFTTLQAAIDAANQHDSILVRPGDYPEPITVVHDKALRIVADGDGVTLRWLGMEGQAPSRTLFIADLSLENLNVGWWDLGSEPVESEVLVQGCTIAPPDGGLQDAVFVTSSTRSVTFVSCTARGGTECHWDACGLSDGGEGYSFGGQRAVAHFCLGFGGNGGTYADGFCTSGCDLYGGNGALVRTPFVFPASLLISSRCYLEGGWGGDGPDDPDLYCCGGPPPEPNFPSAGLDLEAGGEHVPLTTPLARLRFPALLREGESYDIRVVAPAGSEVYLLEADEPDLLPLGPAVGVLHLDLAYADAERHLGTLPSSGSLTVPAVAPHMKAGVESRMRYLQLVVEDGAAPYLSNPVGSLLVDESF
jgi:hypothetical protein